MAGRKSLKEEIRIVERLSELSEPTFKFIRDCLVREATEADNDETRRNIRADKKWAIEQMTKLYAKCIPTEVTGEGGEPIQLVFNPAFLNGSSQETTENSEQPSQVQDSKGGA